MGPAGWFLYPYFVQWMSYWYPEYFYPWYSGFYWTPYRISKEEERAMLEEEKKFLEERLAEINERLAELQKT